MGALPDAWAKAADDLRARGLRWTPARQAIIEVLAASTGHVTGAEIVQRCRERDARTVPSTVYRTLDVLEEIGLVQHGHGAGGQEEYHLRPSEEHGHLYCESCGSSWDLPAPAVKPLADQLAAERGFTVDVSHVALVGRCAECSAG